MLRETPEKIILLLQHTPNYLEGVHNQPESLPKAKRLSFRKERPLPLLRDLPRQERTKLPTNWLLKCQGLIGLLREETLPLLSLAIGMEENQSGTK